MTFRQLILSGAISGLKFRIDQLINGERESWTREEIIKLLDELSILKQKYANLEMG